MDQLPQTRLKQLIRASKRTIEEHVQDFMATARRLNEPSATLSYRQLSRWMCGEVSDARAASMRVAADHWGEPWEALIGPPLAPPAPGAREPGAASAVPVGFDGTGRLPAGLAELRGAVHDTIAMGSLTSASLDDWELVVERHGRATRYVPAPALLVDLRSDLRALQLAMAGPHTASSLRRATRITAELSGLTILTLVKLNQPLAARDWARTARIAADEAADPTVRSWVGAQEAYVYYYAGNLTEAVEVARAAQQLAGRSHCVGVPLAAALEARALAALRRHGEALDAIERAEASLGRLVPAETTRSAFGYDEPQLRFHMGNALTHLREPEAATAHQQQALKLYPGNDFLDRTLVELDRMTCMAMSDVPAALGGAGAVLQALDADERERLIMARAHKLADELPPAQRDLPAVREYRDLLASLADSLPG